MRVQVVTTFSREGYRQYGCRFVRGFRRRWTNSDELVVYADGPWAAERARMLSDVAPLQTFKKRHEGNPRAAGRAQTTCWRPRERVDGYSFKTDAMKFCHKVFVVADAARRLVGDTGEGVLVWCDADVVVIRDVPHGFVESLLGDHDVGYLGREGVHSECGFLMFRLPEALPLIEAWERMYASDDVFALPEWHDSYVFDHVRRRHRGLRYLNMAPGGRGHVWCRSPLAEYLDHLKGDRKELGRSPEHRVRGYRGG